MKVSRETKATGAARPFGRQTNVLGLVLFAFLLVLASTSAGAEEPSQPFATMASQLSLKLTLLEPQGGATVSDPRQPTRLRIEAVCGTAACPARQAKEANKKLRLTAALNGQSIGSLFTRAGSLAKPGGVQMTYVPSAGLPEGENILAARASTINRVRSNPLEARFTLDTTGPHFLEVAPDDGSVLETEQATITGRVDESAATVSLERLQELGGRVISDDPVAFSFEVPLAEGDNSFKLLAEDAAGNRSEKVLRLVRATPIRLEVTEPAQGSTVDTDKVAVKGSVGGPSGTTVKAGQIAATVGPQGNFVAEDVPLVEGANSIVVVATAPDNRSAQQTLEVVYEPAGDPPVTEPPVNEGLGVRDERPPGSPVPTPGPLPEDPSEVASAVDPSTATDTADSTGFLYKGADPIQTGVDAGVVEDRRVAVLKGRVLNTVGAPVAGVRVTVLDHPELGQTLTREDGQYDIAVNGGGTLTLVYEKDRYMPAQRQIETPWLDFLGVEDVVLVGYSRRVTDVDLEGTDEMLVAQGSATTDEEGTRQATVLLPEDTAAQMVLPDGTTRPLPEMDLRATEYTVGEDGPESMPAGLPATSGYTYAVELSVDEAVEAGAEEVRFSRPVYNYVENFLGFPVGTDVPNGYYDRQKDAWVPAADGRVIKVLSTTNGLADLDVDGSGDPAGTAALDALGITTEERAKLAGLYTPGTSLWRVPIDHLTPWDHNWPYGPPDDAEKPDEPKPDEGRDDEDDPECKPGSIIDCHNQILGENLGAAGAPFSLHYASDTVPGRAVSRTVEIPLSDATLPASVRRIELEVEVAGQTFRRTFPAEANQSYTFTWDGKDAYSRSIVGEVDLMYRVGYVYGLVYQQPANFARSFASLSGVPYTASRTTREITLWQAGEAKVASWHYRALGLGGWTPDILHRYDPEEKTLMLGDGDRRFGEEVAPTISVVADAYRTGWFGMGVGPTVAPDGSLYIADQVQSRVSKVAPDGTITHLAGLGYGSAGFSGDGGPAKNARLNYPRGIALAPDGSIYVADTLNHRVRKISPEGIITTVAGTGQQGFSGDGGPAKDAMLNFPIWTAVAPDGTLYISDYSNNRVRKVGLDGTITTVAGNGQADFSGDGGPARNAAIRGPEQMAVGPDGALYVAASGNHRVRKVSPDGIITTVAGNGAFGFSGDGGPARNARLSSPRGIAVDADGTLYIADYGNQRVRKVSPDGIITTIAGTGASGGQPGDVSFGDGGPARDAGTYEPTSTAIAPDGTLYISTWHGIRKVSSPMPDASAGDITIPSEDGTQLYHFDSDGKHLRTLDVATAAVLYRFLYDGAGRLSAVEDVNGLTTRIERDASGDPSAIVAPTGERTALSVDANGYLNDVSNPAGESVALTYDGAGGLLESLTDPRMNTTRFTYDTLGRLTKDEDPASGSKTLSRTEGAGGGFTTSVTTTSGRKTTYVVEHLLDGNSRRVNTDASGLTTTRTLGADGDERVTTPDGTVVETTMGPDPRFGMQSPVLSQATFRTPEGRSRTVKTTRQVTLANPADPLSATSITEKVQIGTRTWTSTFTRATRKLVFTTPEGRTTTTTVDVKGRPVLVEVPGSAPESYAYDARGRLTTVTVGTGDGARAITYGYDNRDRVSTVTDASGGEWSFEYDVAGRLVREIGPGNRILSYAYDANGNLTSITPPGRSAHEFTYDGRDLPTTYSAPSVGTQGRTTTLNRDLDRLPTSRTLPGGGTIEYAYDAGGRLASVRYPGGEKTYTYNPTTGNTASRSGPAGTLQYAFDGNLPLSETSTGQIPGKVELRYDSDLRISGVVVNGTEVTYAYDRDDLVTRAGSLNISREAQRGIVMGSTLQNTTDGWSYNTFGEPATYEALSGTSPLFRATYDRDAEGRIIAMTENVEGASTTYAYSYDDEGRLRTVTRDGVLSSYTYDANGNRLSRTTPGGTTEAAYDAQDRLTSYGDYEYQYTPDGHLESKTDTGTGEITTYTHDALGNLLSANLPGSKRIEYIVDASDRRVGKKVDGQLVQGFLYQGQLSPVAELDGAGNVVSRFVYATKPNVPDYMVKGGETYRIVSDHLGSVRLVVNASTGQIVQRLDYDELGNVLQDTNPGFQPFGYAGGLYDRDTGLVHFGARDYDPEIGRWVQKDPIGFGGGDANLYAYVSNDPINWVDPSGLFAMVCINGNNIDITIPIKYVGKGATKENIRKINEGIRKHWTGKFGKYNVKTHTTHGFGNVVKLSTQNGRSHVASDSLIPGHVAGSGNTWFVTDADLGWVAAHEAGHLMGLRDEYVDIKGKSHANPGHERNIMAERSGKVWKEDIDMLVQLYEDKQGKCKKC